MPKLKIEPDYKDAYTAWKANENPHTTNQLLQQISPILDTAVKYYSAGAPGPVTQGQAKIMGIEALHTYDPSRGPLRPHVLSHLQRLRRLSAQERQIIRIPERVVMDQQAISSAEIELEDKLSRPPSTAELADYTGFSARRIATVRQVPWAQTESAAIRINEEGLPQLPASETLGETNDASWLIDVVYHSLGSVDQRIMERLMGLYGNKKQTATAVAKELGISSAAVSQRVKRIQDMLDEAEQYNL